MLVQTSRSMIILDATGMPVNLQEALREDSPESGFPVLAYDGKNVLPTALGYRSFFGEFNFIDLTSLPDGTLVQHGFSYQSPSMYTIQVALCEDGLYVAPVTVSTDGAWVKVVDKPATPDVRRLWTFAVISNKLYMYQQGDARVYALMDAASWNETTIPSGIAAPAAKVKIWDGTAYGCGIQEITVNFLNMEGQIGIFKAGNRLGFWDSNGAVAWSSATQVYDFVPSTTTFAGITTFVDVVGNIVMIKQHGTGFIIYATKSITLCSMIVGSPEKWTGRAIFSDVGVVFDCQVAVGQPDTVHFAITSGGLAKIDSGNASFVETEVMDYVKENNEIYALSFMEGRYLFIHAIEELNNPIPTADIIVKDSAGGEYHFPKPQIPSEDFNEQFEQYLNGELPGSQEDFTDAQEPIPEVPPPSNNERLLPCYSGEKFYTNFVDVPDTVEGDFDEATVEANVYSYFFDALAKGFIEGEDSDFYYYTTNDNFYDVGPEEFVTLISEELDKIEQVRARAAELMLNLGQVTELPPIDPYEGPLPDVAIGNYNYTGENIEGPTTKLENILTSYETKLTDCGMQVLGQVSDCIATVYIKSHTEQVELPENSPIWETVGVLCAARRSAVYPEETWENSAFGYYVVDVTDTKLMPLNDIAATMLSALYGAEISVNEVFTITDTVGLTATAHVYDKLTNTWGEYTAQELVDRDAGSLSVGVVRQYIERAVMAEAVGMETNQLSWSVFSTNPSAGTSSPGCSDTSEVVTTDTWAGMASIPPRAIGVWDRVGDNDYFDQGEVITATNTTTLYVYTDEFSGSCQRHPNNATNWINRNIEYRYLNYNSRLLEAYSSISRLYGNFTDNQFAMNQALQFVTPGVVYSVEELNAAKYEGATYLSYLPKKLTYVINTVVTGIELEDRPDKEVIFEAEVSGYGYYANKGTTFTRTHSRSLIKPCGYDETPRIWTMPSLGDVDIDKGLDDEPTGAEKPNTPIKWNYPDPIPLPTNYYLLQLGTTAPYYPVWSEAIVLDLQLNKWGRYNNPHRGLHSLFPINRTDQTVIFNSPMRVGAITPDNRFSIFGEENPYSSITYGKIGVFRQGYTKVTKISAQFATPPNVDAIVEVSLDGQLIDPALSEGSHMDTIYAEMPFTFEGKWSTMRLDGTFNLVNLAIELGKGGRR